MVVDTSALIAVLEQEPEAHAVATAIEADPSRLLSAASFLETAIVVTARRGEAAGRELDLLIHKARIEVMPVTREHAEVGRHAFLRSPRINCAGSVRKPNSGR
jgi:ribonuclease VapC